MKKLFATAAIIAAFSDDGLHFLDSRKIHIGGPNAGQAEGDLQIYNKANVSYLRIDDGNPLLISKGEGSEDIAKFIPDGAVELYYDNLRKFRTVSDGCEINATEGGDAVLALIADEGDDNADYWKIESNASTNNLNIANYSSGSWANKVSILSGGGLTFNGDTAAANALDDYEEGTWTPTVAGWDTYTPYSGASYNYNWYTKIGNLVHVGWKLYIQNLTTVSSDAHIRISGLPFAHQTYAAGAVGHIRFDIPEYGMSGYPIIYLAGGGTILYMYKHVNGSSSLAAMNAAANRSNVWCMGTATYATS